jgi:hypothetical protein
MKFFKKIFSKTDSPILSNEDFWNWFTENEKGFFNIIKEQSDIEENFFNKISPKLNELKEGFFYLTGMLDDNTVELVLTADGTIKNFIFVEQLVKNAPIIQGWKFTALKPPVDGDNFGIEMSGYKFNTENIHFYSNDNPNQPDEIDITLVYKDLDDENRSTISNGVFIFLDNYLGEINFATLIDNMTIIGSDKVEKELIPVEQLKPFLVWREKEFEEKYASAIISIEDYKYSIFKGESPNGKPLFAAINTELLTWNNKASHPWILKFELFYDGSKNDGLPDGSMFKLLDKIEDELISELKDINGHLNIGRESAENVRLVYFACNEYRESSKIAQQILKKHRRYLDISYEIYKDKYWQSFAYYA